MFLQFNDNLDGDSSIEPANICFGCENKCWLGCTSCDGCSGCSTTCSGKTDSNLSR